MLRTNEIKNFLRDLMYVEEDAYQVCRNLDVPFGSKTRILDNIKEKQIIIAKIINLIVNEP